MLLHGISARSLHQRQLIFSFTEMEESGGVSFSAEETNRTLEYSLSSVSMFSESNDDDESYIEITIDDSAQQDSKDELQLRISFSSLPKQEEDDAHLSEPSSPALLTWSSARSSSLNTCSLDTTTTATSRSSSSSSNFSKKEKTKGSRVLNFVLSGFKCASANITEHQQQEPVNPSYWESVCANSRRRTMNSGMMKVLIKCGGALKVRKLFALLLAAKSCQSRSLKCIDDGRCRRTLSGSQVHATEQSIEAAIAHCKK